MTSQPDDAIIFYLKRIDARLTDLGADMTDVRRRLTTIGSKLGQLIVTQQSHHTVAVGRFDLIEQGIICLERQADIALPVHILDDGTLAP